MNNKKLSNYQSKENYINYILIGANILNIFGNNVYDKYKIERNINIISKAKVYYFLGLFITLGVYVYFLKRNKENIIELEKRGKDTGPSIIRLFGSSLFVIGIICFIYYQANEEFPNGSPEI